jgi:hypothetical protein
VAPQGGQSEACPPFLRKRPRTNKTLDRDFFGERAKMC